jgi:hypothetical protein
MTTAGSATTTNTDDIFKTLYPSRRVKFLGYQGNPLLALMPKSEGFVGRNKQIPIWYGGNHGTSRVFSTAQANKTEGKYESFYISRKKDYGLTSIETEAILASAEDPGAFLSLARSEVDNLVRNVSRNIAISMYRRFGGARGRVAAISSTELTLTNKADVANFEVGMKLQQDDTDGTAGGSVGAATPVKITAVDRRAGKIYGAAWTGFSVNDYLFRHGDFGASYNGLADWVPETTPTSGDSFNGVDRSTDSRLYGMFHDGTGQSKVEAIEDLDSQLSFEGGQPDVVLVHPFDMNNLRKELGSNVVYEMMSSPDMPVVSFKAIGFQSMSGKTLKIVPDRNCPYGEFAMLQLDTWELASLGGAPQILQAMDNKFIWDADGDSVEIRVGAYMNLGCYAPGFNGRGRFHSGVDA